MYNCGTAGELKRHPKFLNQHNINISLYDAKHGLYIIFYKEDALLIANVFSWPVKLYN